MHIVCRSVWRLLNRVFDFEAEVDMISFLNVCGFSSIGTFRKETRAPRSSRLFCIGVPERHHRCSAERLETAWYCFVERFRMSCAGPVSSGGRSSKPEEIFTFVEHDSEPFIFCKGVFAPTELGCNCGIGGKNYSFTL
jgi:hypothetical protein